MKYNKKGFSMVELLAVITILGILSTISIISVQRILDKSKDEYYDKQKKNLVMAAQSYLQNAKEMQPKVLGQKVELTLGELKKNKYIDKVVDYSKEACSDTETKIEVFNYSENEDYNYNAYLKCPNYSDKTEEKKSLPYITVTMPNQDQIKNTQAKVEIKATETVEDITLFSYSYKILKKESGKWIDAKIQKTKNANNQKSKTFTIDIKDFIPGIIKIEVTATNSIGKTTIYETKETAYGDKYDPICNYLSSEDDGRNDKKIEFQDISEKEIKIKCTDHENDSGCVNEYYTKKFYADTRKSTIRIADKAGRYTDCPVNVFIDQKSPEIEIDKKKTSEDTYETDWTNKDVCFTYTATDGGGIKSVKWEENSKGLSLCNNSKGIDDLKVVSKYTKTYGEKDSEVANKRSGKICITEEGFRKGKLTVTDYKGNSSILNVIAKIDKTAPTQPTTVSMFKWNDNNLRPNNTSGLKGYTNNTWSNKKVYTESSGSTDKISCIKEYQNTTTGAVGNKTEGGSSKNIELEGISTIKYRACDNAGNCSSYTPERTIKLDWTAPTPPVVTLKKWNNNSTKPVSSSGLQNYPNNTWSNRKVYTESSGSTDKTSGGVYYEVTTTGKTTNVTNYKASSRNIEAQGESNIKYRACDNAGNCSAYSTNYTVKIDTSNPVCESIGGLGGWTNQNRRITAYCKDDVSGCRERSTYRDFTWTSSTDSITIYDNAGNSTRCNFNVNVDKTPPSCNGVWGDATWWTNGDRSIGVGCSDGESGCTQGSFSRYFNWTSWTDSITIWDRAGNSRNCGVNVYVDKTPPSVWVVSGPYSNRCGGAVGVTTRYQAHDGESGLYYVGDWYGYDNSFDTSNLLTRHNGWSRADFDFTHNWSSRCTRVRAPAANTCYKLKVQARDAAGNYTNYISPGCAYRG